MEEDCKGLQEDLDRIYEWSQEWEIKFNAKKCKVLEMGTSTKRSTWDYLMGKENIHKAKWEKDLGVLVQDTPSPENTWTKLLEQRTRC